MLLEVDGEPIAHLGTTALLQHLRGPEGSEVDLLIQRVSDGELIDLKLTRVLRPDGDAAEKKGFFMSTMDAAGSMAKTASMAKVPSISEGLMGMVRGKSKKGAGSPSAAGGGAKQVGIGIGFTLDDDGNFVITKIMPNGAAAETGKIRKGDVINKCDGFELTAMTLKELVAHIKGAPGTSLALELVRGNAKPFSVTVVRKAEDAAAASSGSSIYNLVNKIGSTASAAVTSTVSTTAGGASATLSSITSLMDKLPHITLRSGKAAASESAAESVGVGLGIKKNQHGDFMVTDVSPGGPAARSGRIAVGDILQMVGDRDLSRIKSSALRELILGPPGSTVKLVFARWTADPSSPEGGSWQRVGVALTRDRKPPRAPPPASSSSAAAAAASKPSPAKKPVAAKPAVAPAPAAAATRPRPATKPRPAAGGGAKAGDATAAAAKKTGAPAAGGGTAAGAGGQKPVKRVTVAKQAAAAKGGATKAGGTPKKTKKVVKSKPAAAKSTEAPTS